MIRPMQAAQALRYLVARASCGATVNEIVQWGIGGVRPTADEVRAYLRLLIAAQIAEVGPGPVKGGHQLVLYRVAEPFRDLFAAISSDRTAERGQTSAPKPRHAGEPSAGEAQLATDLDVAEVEQEVQEVGPQVPARQRLESLTTAPRGSARDPLMDDPLDRPPPPGP